MKHLFSTLLFLVLLNSFLSKFESELIPIELKETDSTRHTYKIQTNKNYEIYSTKEEYIYFLELPEGITVQDVNKTDYTQLAVISSTKSNLTISATEEIGKEVELKVVPISNLEVEAAMNNKPNFRFATLLTKNLIYLVHVQDEDQIITFNSFENSVAFSFWKYEYLKENDPSDIYPINRTLFKRYDDSILTLDKNSVYVFVAEIYKIDSIINSIDIFCSPLEVEKEIDLIYDCLYLKESDQPYNISFNESNLNRIIKLSAKTNTAVVKLGDQVILNKEKRYYELTQDQITNGIELTVSNDNALIEILFSSNDDTDILDSYEKDSYQLKKKYTIIKIPNNKCIYHFIFSSENKNNLKKFYFRYNHKISKGKYFYNALNVSAEYEPKGINFLISTPYLYRNEIDNDEFQIFEIILSEEQLNNGINISYGPAYYFKLLHQNVDEKKAQYLTGNISDYLSKYYIYKDIAKKPPEIENLKNYHHPPIDIVNALKEIPTQNQTHFSLYQNIFKVLNSIRDGHLGIFLTKIDDFDLSSSLYCSPFDFYVDIVSDEPVIKVRAYDECLAMSEQSERIEKFINDHINIPLKSINNTDPFDFIQNFTIYQIYRSKHAQFTDCIDAVKRSSIRGIPHDLSDITDIEYEFDNGDIIKMDYIIVQVSKLQGVNTEEFMEFYHSRYYNEPNQHLIPNLFKARKIFLKSKGLLFEENNKNVNWDVQTEDGILKCKVDKEKHYNVFLQTGFSFDDYYNAIDVMKKCAELFYSNDYKIIGIENQNGGGTAVLYEIWHQLIQQKTLDKTYRSLITTEEVMAYSQESHSYSNYADIKTCKYYSANEAFTIETDNYGYSDIFKQDIKHNRTNVFDYLDKTWRKRLSEIRKKNLENKSNLKKSTDIIIFTDGYCFSACSGFVKAFQDTGGAIIVGFNGNPKIKGTSQFDGSQSSSSVRAFSSPEYDSIESLGYHISGVTYAESFDDSYQNKSKTLIPREYTVDLVDRRVPIYSEYSDDLYDSFIDHADKIFKEFEEKCSLNNMKLLLDDEACNEKLKDHEKGGHPCGADEKWDKTKCEAYYCDLGYYYDQYKKECILDTCTNQTGDQDVYVNNIDYLETKEYTVDKDSEIIFHIENDSYYYFIESNVDNIITVNSMAQGIDNYTNFFILQKPPTDFDLQISINYFRNIDSSAKVKITAVEKNEKIVMDGMIYSPPFQASTKVDVQGEQVYISSLQFTGKCIFFTPSYIKGVKTYYHEYNYDITPQEVINIEPTKFKENTNKIVVMEANKDYIYIMQFPKDIASNLFQFLNPFENNQDIPISENRFVFLSQKNLEYKFYIQDSEKIYIKLCSQTPEAEVEIVGQNVILNKNNKYFLNKDNLKQFSLKLKNDNYALIEVLYEFTTTIEDIDINKKTIDLIRGKLYKLKYSKKDKIESFKLNITANASIEKLVFYPNIGRDNYVGGIPYQIDYGDNSIVSEFQVPNDELNDDEIFNVLIATRVNSTLNLESTKLKDGNTDDGDDLPTWALIVIIAVGVILLIIIIFIIIRCIGKGKVDADSIEKGNLLNSYNNE